MCQSPNSNFQSSIPNIQYPILDPRATYLVTDVLSDNDARSEQFGLFSSLRLPFPAAAKTGTTTKWRDNWTLGYTPQRVVGVWVGNADGRPMSHISGVDGAGPIWHDVMLAAQQQLPVEPFVEPPGIVRREVCITNGLTPGPDCPYRRTELYLAESPIRPTETEYTRVDGQLVWRAPAELRDWARTNGIPFAVADQRPTTNDDRPPTADNTQYPIPATSCSLSPCHLVTLSSPAPNTHALLDPHLPPDTQQLEVTAIVGDEAGTEHVEFMVDGVAWASLDAAPYRAWWTLTVGAHQLVAVAIDRQGNRWPSEPVTVIVER